MKRKVSIGRLRKQIPYHIMLIPSVILADFSSGLTLESTQLITFDQTYTTPQHKSSQYRDYFNQREIVTTKNNQTRVSKWTL